MARAAIHVKQTARNAGNPVPKAREFSRQSWWIEYGYQSKPIGKMITSSMAGILPSRILALAAGLLVWGCQTASTVSSEKSPETAQELVLKEGTTITVSTPLGEAKIIAGAGLERTYRWAECSLDAKMVARKDRQLGKLGIFDEARPAHIGAGTPENCRGIADTAGQEAQLQITDPAFFKRWSDSMAAGLATFWTSDGLVVTWGPNVRSRQLFVSVIQICEFGERPKQLQGARDDLIKIESTFNASDPRHDCAKHDPLVEYYTKSHHFSHWRSFDPSAKARDNVYTIPKPE